VHLCLPTRVTSCSVTSNCGIEPCDTQISPPPTAAAAGTAAVVPRWQPTPSPHRCVCLIIFPYHITPTCPLQAKRADATHAAQLVAGSSAAFFRMSRKAGGAYYDEEDFDDYDEEDYDEYGEYDDTVAGNSKVGTTRRCGQQDLTALPCRCDKDPAACARHTSAPTLRPDTVLMLLQHSWLLLQHTWQHLLGGCVFRCAFKTSLSRPVCVAVCWCPRERMATRLRPARQPPSQRTTSPWRQLLQQVLLHWPLSSATRLPCGLTADLNGGVGTRQTGPMLAVPACAHA
jgi:hypothetical protein